MRGLLVVHFCLLFTMLYQRNMVMGVPAFNKTATDGMSESNKGDSIDAIQTRMACSYDSKDWCQVGHKYYIPCNLPKECPSANSKFMECRNGMCNRCAFKDKPCASDVECCQARDERGDNKVEPKEDSFCKFGTCSFCKRFQQQCEYRKSDGLRDACCPTKGQKDVACRAINVFRASFCIADPCASGNLKQLSAPGFVQAVPRWGSYKDGESGNFDYQCVNKRTCVRCLGYNSNCGTAIQTRDKCCDYLICNEKNKCKFKDNCFIYGFKCRTNSDCCQGLYCRIVGGQQYGNCNISYKCAKTMLSVSCR